MTNSPDFQSQEMIISPDHTISQILGPPPGEVPMLELSDDEKETCMVYNFGGSFDGDQGILSAHIILIYKKGVIIGCFANVHSLIKDSQIGKITTGTYNENEIDHFLEIMKAVTKYRGQFVEITGEKIDLDNIQLTKEMLDDPYVINIIKKVKNDLTNAN